MVKADAYGHGALQVSRLLQENGADYLAVSCLDEAMELRRGGTSYTADTLEQMQQLHPRDEIFLVMGSDMFLSLHEWYMPEKIMALATIVLMHREAPGAQMAQQLQRMMGWK